MPSLTDSPVNRRLDEWKQRLIDLTRRNRLLYFQPTKGSTVKIGAPDAAAIFERLYDNEKLWRFWLPQTKAEGEQSATNGWAEVVEDKILPQASARNRPQSDELFCDGLSSKQLEQKLKSLLRRARTDYQERGVRVLYLAFGALRWREQDNSLGENVSPLVLCPVDLRRESAAEPFQLFWAEEDLVLNPALATKLKQDFRLELPPVSDDFDAQTLLDFFTRVGKQVKKLNWTIEPSVHLGLFSFHKLAIYQDLKDNAASVAANQIVRGFGGESLRTDQLAPIPRERELDRVQQPAETFQILDADSSQQQAIQAALRGHNLVLHGPPGTGKSQTIANIVAEFLARNKTVLFVSEKMAALEVVYKRLKEAHLNEFCLELHSHKANKREVINTLKDALDTELEPHSLPQTADFARLEAARGKLNEYVKAIHIVREPLGKSVRDVLSLLTNLKDAAYIALPLEDAAALDVAAVVGREVLIKQMATVWHVFAAGLNFVWFGCLERQFNVSAQAAWERLLKDCREKLEALQTAANDFAAAVGVDAPANLVDCGWIINTGRHLNQSLAPDASWLTSKELDAVTREAEFYRATCADYWREHEILLNDYHETIFNVPPQTSERLRELWRKINKNSIAASDSRGALLLLKRDETLEFLQHTETFVRMAKQDAAFLAESFGVKKSSISVRRAAEIAELAGLTTAADKPEESWLDAQTLETVTATAKRLRPKYAAFNEKKVQHDERRAKLLERYDAEIFALDLTKLIENFSGFLHTSFARFFNPGFYRDKRIILGVSRRALGFAGSARN